MRKFEFGCIQTSRVDDATSLISLIFPAPTLRSKSHLGLRNYAFSAMQPCPNPMITGDKAVVTPNLDATTSFYLLATYFKNRLIFREFGPPIRLHAKFFETTKKVHEWQWPWLICRSPFEARPRSAKALPIDHGSTMRP